MLLSLKSGEGIFSPPRTRSLGKDNLADVIQAVLVEGIAVGKVSDLQIDGLLVVVLGLVGVDLALHVQSANSASAPDEQLPLC